ncbi:hypothetical protein O181_020483 [Austropuccinia psidii MF-1]|uniref:chitinase n=1 Tax=Austropuccinia psidii MF-1 TaxID=1389203 RepID=A0A9Q3CBI1_9BASI|nr:hypothetical protein [Austropuccinia psidii MF-1]
MTTSQAVACGKSGCLRRGAKQEADSHLKLSNLLDCSNSNRFRRLSRLSFFRLTIIGVFILLINISSTTTMSLHPPTLSRQHSLAVRATQIASPKQATAQIQSQGSDYVGTDAGNNKGNGYISSTYYVNWAIYARNHFPWNVPLDSVTHVLYAFANVRPESGEVYLTDSWADEQIHWPEKGDSWNDQGNNLYGCFNQFRQIKQTHRHLKLLLSIGGWTYSANFAPATDSPAKRQKFADSAISILENYGLDGLDIDWEYPNSDDEAERFVDILRRTRAGLTQLKEKKKDVTPYLLTIAAPCGPSHYKQLHLKSMAQYLSFINLMAYDYSGSWDTITGHQANLLLPENRSINQGNVSTVAALNYYISQSVPASKLVMGMPLYGRSFLNTKGIGHPYNGVGKGSWESGVYDYKDISKANVQWVDDKNAVGAYTYNPSTQELITFDDSETVRQKVQYIRQKGLGGVMWWESSGDKNGTDALIPLAAKLLGNLDTTSNHILYPDSKWDNLKKTTQPSSAPQKTKTQRHNQRSPSHTHFHTHERDNKEEDSQGIC